MCENCTKGKATDFMKACFSNASAYAATLAEARTTVEVNRILSEEQLRILQRIEFAATTESGSYCVAREAGAAGVYTVDTSAITSDIQALAELLTDEQWHAAWQAMREAQRVRRQVLEDIRCGREIVPGIRTLSLARVLEYVLEAKS